MKKLNETGSRSGFKLNGVENAQRGLLCENLLTSLGIDFDFGKGKLIMRTEKLLASLLCSVTLAIGITTQAFGEFQHARFSAKFSLLDVAGKPVTESILQGKLTLVYFGYTSCLMQCPPSWITLDGVKTGLGDKSDQVSVLFISLDPQRDSVEVIAEWQKSWPQITALTGSNDQIHEVADNFHVFYAKKPKHAVPFAMKDMKRIREMYQGDDRIKWDKTKPENYYMVDHTTQTFLLGRNGEYLTHFELEEDVETVLKVIQDYL